MTNKLDPYEHLLLEAMPTPCARALDVGCGHGRFARQLAQRADVVDALDRVELGVAATAPANVRFVRADLMEDALQPTSYDFISAIASLHHVPFAPAIERLKLALAPRGVLAILGLFRDDSLVDFALSAVAFPLSRIHRLAKPRATSHAPLRPPTLSLAEIRDTTARLLPGAVITRHLFWRYTLLWTNE